MYLGAAKKSNFKPLSHACAYTEGHCGIARRWQHVAPLLPPRGPFFYLLPEWEMLHWLCRLAAVGEVKGSGEGWGVMLWRVKKKHISSTSSSSKLPSKWGHSDRMHYPCVPGPPLKIYVSLLSPPRLVGWHTDIVLTRRCHSLNEKNI